MEAGVCKVTTLPPLHGWRPTELRTRAIVVYRSAKLCMGLVDAKGALLNSLSVRLAPLQQFILSLIQGWDLALTVTVYRLRLDFHWWTDRAHSSLFVNIVM